MEKGEGAVDKSVGVMILVDTLFEAFKEELTTAKKRSEVTVVYVDDDYAHCPTATSHLSYNDPTVATGT